MSFYGCSDFAFNFNLIVKLKMDNLTGNNIKEAVSEKDWAKTYSMLRNWPSFAKVADWLDNMPEGKTANWVLGNHDNWRIGSRYHNYTTWQHTTWHDMESWFIKDLDVVWDKLTMLCTLEEEDMLRFGAGNMDGFNMIGLLLPGVAVTYNGEEIGNFFSPWNSDRNIIDHQCNKCNVAMCLFHSPSIY